MTSCRHRPCWPTSRYFSPYLHPPIGTMLNSWEDFVALRFVIYQKIALQICSVCNFDLNLYLVVESHLDKSPGVCKNKIRPHLSHRQLDWFDAFVVVVVFFSVHRCPDVTFAWSLRKQQSELYINLATNKLRPKVMKSLVFHLQNFQTGSSYLDPKRFEECLFYLRKYGSPSALVDFYVRHGHLRLACRYVIDQVSFPALFSLLS